VPHAAAQLRDTSREAFFTRHQFRFGQANLVFQAELGNVSALRGRHGLHIQMLQ